jgi:hypothetical protein
MGILLKSPGHPPWVAYAESNGGSSQEETGMTLITPEENLFAVIDSALSNAELVRQPFPHFALTNVLDDGTADAILMWLELDATWTLESQSFYIQHGCARMADRLNGTPAAAVASPMIFDIIRPHLERVFRTSLSRNRFDLVAHRLLPGHRIGIHNDCPSYGTETHRFLINLNRGFEDTYGGHLVLFSRDSPSESAVILRPLHNSAAAMEFSDRSWHCVDEVIAGARYSLIYSFWTTESVEASEADETGQTGAEEYCGLPEQVFRQLVSVLRDLGANAVPHSNRYLIDHLTGTAALLSRWRCDVDVCKAGLFHTILGTASFTQSLAGEDSAGLIRNAIGERALLLVRLFRLLDWQSLLKLIDGNNLLEGGGFVTVSARDVAALVSLHWANALEQMAYVEHCDEEIERLKSLYTRMFDLLPAASHGDIRAALSLD